MLLRHGSTLVMAARHSVWPSLFNTSGLGRARFSPVGTPAEPVPTAYLAATDTVALLETVFHEVATAERVLIDRTDHLAPWLLARVTAPCDVRLVDLRDPALDRLRIGREQLVSTSQGHYRCTQGWAEALCGRVIGGHPTSGLIWHSRVAEIGGAASAVLADVGSEVCVLFGDDLPTGAIEWSADVRYGDLTSGAGLTHVEEVATLLGATIV